MFLFSTGVYVASIYHISGKAYMPKEGNVSEGSLMSGVEHILGRARRR